MEKPSVPLEELPVEWSDKWVCEETHEHRTILRDAGYRWAPVPPEEDGLPTGLMMVVLPETIAATRWEQYKDILEDRRDPWSDYVDVRELPLDVTGVPYWIYRRVQKYEEWEAKSKEGRTTKKAPYLPTRCTMKKKDGTRCWSWAADRASEGVCRAHAPHAFRAADQGHQIMVARMKMLQAAPAMADVLEELAQDAASEQVRLKAAETILDRVGVGASTDLNISLDQGDGTKSAADEIRGKLAALASRIEAPKETETATDDSIIDAEVVEEERERRP